MRTRSGKGNPSDSVTPAPQTHQPEATSSNSSKGSRKLKRSSSNNSMHSQIHVGGRPPIVAYYKKPTLTIFGLPEDLLEELAQQDQENSSSNRAIDDEGHVEERPKRQGRGRPPSKIQKRFSPRKRRGGARQIQIRKSLPDVDEEEAALSRNGTPSLAAASDHDRPIADDFDQDEQDEQEEEEEEEEEDDDDDDDDDVDDDDDERDETLSSPPRPRPSPSQQLIDETVSAVRGTPASISASKGKPVYIDEELDEDEDLPPAFASDWGTPSETDIDDFADTILKRRFSKMTDPQKLIVALTKHVPAERTTKVLYRLAENAQTVLKMWQDEYLAIDKRVAVHANNGPRKPVNGGRVPVDPQVFDDQKEADIYGYVYDSRKAPGNQDPFAQRVGTDFVGGRELRHRRARDVTTEDLQGSEEEVGKRKRRAVQRFDGTAEPASRTRKRENGGSETPEPQIPRKRGRIGRGGRVHPYVPQRIREMRGESAMTTSASDDDHDADDGAYDGGTPEPKGKRRGRPPGSKNLAQRKDAGIKKGPRGKRAQQQPTSADQTNGIQPTFTSAPATSSSQTYQPLTQQQPFAVQGYTHAPPSNIPPASMAPVPGLNVDPTYMQHSHQQQHQAPLVPGPSTTPVESPIPPINSQPTATSAPSTAATTTSTTTPASGHNTGRKKGVKSEKRSQSMTQWWAERKARQAEARAADQQRAAAAAAAAASAANANATTTASASAANSAAVLHNAQQPYTVNGLAAVPQPYTGPYPQPNTHYSNASPYAAVPAPAKTGHSQGGQQGSFRAIAPQQQHQHHQQHQQQYGRGHGHQVHHGPFGGAGSPPAPPPPPPLPLPPFEGHHGGHHGVQGQGGEQSVPDSVRRDILGLRGHPEPRRL